MTPHLQLLLLTLFCVSQALTQAYLQVQYLGLDVSKHIAEHSCFCCITSCPYHHNYCTHNNTLLYMAGLSIPICPSPFICHHP